MKFLSVELELFSSTSDTYYIIFHQHLSHLPSILVISRRYAQRNGILEAKLVWTIQISEPYFILGHPVYIFMVYVYLSSLIYNIPMPARGRTAWNAS